MEKRDVAVVVGNVNVRQEHVHSLTVPLPPKEITTISVNQAVSNIQIVKKIIVALVQDLVVLPQAVSAKLRQDGFVQERQMKLAQDSVLHVKNTTHKQGVVNQNVNQVKFACNYPATQT